MAASPGAAKGEIVFTAEDAVAAAADGRHVILVRPFTEAEDVAGFYAAQGILTAEGGKASHAALVARGMGRPAVTGASELDINLKERTVTVGDTVLSEGDCIAIDGTTGNITIDDVPLVDPEMTAHFEQVLTWCDELRTLGVRANADTPEDARKARAFGAEGIGLCRTEHMFMAADRQPKMREMILSDTIADRRAALDELLPLQQEDFEQVFEAMDGLPVTVRLLDPPLHEFLPPDEEDPRAHALREVNPMLGTRGCRLAILYPEIYEMQVRAIMRAARAVKERLGHVPLLEVMIPLIDYERELEILRELVHTTAAEEQMAHHEDYLVGTMIELPRACFLADTIAEQADFFSFGTNDLTQTALGFSRDDIEGKILARYIEMKIFDRSPFETIDTPGVGQLVRMGAWLGRKTKPDLKLGVCGEHGGDPDSIDFFHHSGIDYVSCSPVPRTRCPASPPRKRTIRATERRRRSHALRARGDRPEFGRLVRGRCRAERRGRSSTSAWRAARQCRISLGFSSIWTPMRCGTPLRGGRSGGAVRALTWRLLGRPSVRQPSNSTPVAMPASIFGLLCRLRPPKATSF